MRRRGSSASHHRSIREVSSQPASLAAARFHESTSPREECGRAARTRGRSRTRLSSGVRRPGASGRRGGLPRAIFDLLGRSAVKPEAPRSPLAAGRGFVANAARARERAHATS